MAEPQLELRILTGVHAGARTPADQQFTIGTDPGCDIVLTDRGVAARHARIELGGDRWTVVPLQPIEGAPAEGIELPSGARIALGKVLISIDAANAPWQVPSAEETLSASEAVLEEDPGQSSEPQAADTDAATDTSTAPELGAPPETAAVPSTVYVPAWWKRARFLLPAVALAIVALVATWILLPTPASHPEPGAAPAKRTGPGGTTQGTAPASSPAATRTRPDLAQIDSILKTHAADLPVRALLQADGSALVSGYVKSEDDYLTLAEALAKVHPRPGIKLVNEQEVSGDVAQWNRGNSRRKLVLTYQGMGRFRISGPVRDAAARATLVKEVRAEFPMLQELEQDLVAFSQLALDLEQELRGGGIDSLRVKWEGEQLELTVAEFPTGGLGALEASLLRFNARSGGELPFRVRVSKPSPAPPQAVAAKPAPPPAPVPARLPFEIRSVAGGAMPFVVLADGTVVLLGGEVQGYRLAAVGATEIVFEGKGRVVIQR